MTVAELIEALRQMPQEAEVYTHGFEGGLLPMNCARAARVWWSGMDDDRWYWGSHEEAEGGAPSVVLEHEGDWANSGLAQTLPLV